MTRVHRRHRGDLTPGQHERHLLDLLPVGDSAHHRTEDRLCVEDIVRAIPYLGMEVYAEDEEEETVGV